MSRSRRFNVVIVPNDGSRHFRLNIAQAVLPAILIPLACAMLIVAVVIGDYVRARAVASHAVALYAKLTEQQRVAESVRSRVTAISNEVSAWRQLHAKIMEPFGPRSAADLSRGIGGPRTGSLDERGLDRISALDELERLAAVIRDETQKLSALEQVMVRAARAIALLPSRWPVRGDLNSEFGLRRSPWTAGTEFHSGIDIGAERGTSVRAPAPGTVVAAGGMGEYGLAVILEHNPDLQTIYGHLSKVQVSPGQRVERDQVFALTGNTGKSTAPHLHYEILVKGQSVNPRAYLWD